MKMLIFTLCDNKRNPARSVLLTECDMAYKQQVSALDWRKSCSLQRMVTNVQKQVTYKLQRQLEVMFYEGAVNRYLLLKGQNCHERIQTDFTCQNFSLTEELCEIGVVTKAVTQLSVFSEVFLASVSADRALLPL